MTSAARILQAARFAAEKHKDQRRKDADAVGVKIDVVKTVLLFKN